MTPLARLSLRLGCPLLLTALLACGSDGPAASEDVVLATTTSTQDSGLLDVLVPAFEETADFDVKVIAVGSGQAIELGRRGEADVLLVHSPAAEEELMRSDAAGDRRLVMHNDFVLIGPAADPANVGSALSPAAALAAVADSEATFVSRGDESGTHALELRLWEEADRQPSGPWYEESGQGMGATLQIADEQDAYTISDRATYLTAEPPHLEVLYEGGPELLNVYHVIDMTEDAGERVNERGGTAFSEWIVSEEAQALIGRFGAEEFGRSIFVPDAGRSEDELAEDA